MQDATPIIFAGTAASTPGPTGDAPDHGQFYAVTVASLDDLAVDALMAAPIRHIDGRNDNWVTPPAEIRHL